MGGMIQVLLTLSLLCIIEGEVVGPHMRGKGPIAKPMNPQKKVMCSQDSLMIYFDCRMCTCPKPNRPARCFRKSCDLKTKDGGQCPPTILKMDDSKLCPHNFKAECKVDNDCPDQQLCCFDFCHGAKCVNSIPLEPTEKVHGGRGYH